MSDKELGCVFCDILTGSAPADKIREFDNALIIVPLNPVVDGHVIAISKTHVSDATQNPFVAGETMEDVSTWVLEKSEVLHDERYKSVNYITSVGKPATQSVFHLHIHVIPRSKNDGLALPWYSGKSGSKLHSTKFVLEERERELLELKGPCTSEGCPLHYAHYGPCNITKEV